MTETTTNVVGTLTAGDDWSFTLTCKKDGATADLTGATVTTSLSQNGVIVIVDKACTLTGTPTDGKALFSLTETDTANFMPGIISGDVKAVISGVTTHYGPYTINVRSAITG